MARFVMGFQNVNSSAIKDMYYCPADQTLRVTYRSGNESLYEYPNFTADEFAKLVDVHTRGESLGRYLAFNIHRLREYTRLRE